LRPGKKFQGVILTSCVVEIWQENPQKTNTKVESLTLESWILSLSLSLSLSELDTEIIMDSFSLSQSQSDAEIIMKLTKTSSS
jgi:hypothetical protein